MIEKQRCGTVNGRDLWEFTITNGEVCLQVMEYGATIHRLCFQGVDCVAGYDDLSGYLTGNSFQGATIGRYANRIGGASFAIDGKVYTVEANDNQVNSLHGGSSGFHGGLFIGRPVDETAVTFTLRSPHGEGGYPGNLCLDVTFRVENNGVTVTYQGVSDRTTVMNFTNHTYFHLGAESCLDTVLQIKADAITPVDELLIPTGELMDVTRTPFDFRTPKAIGRDILAEHAQLQLGGGYDHNFVLGHSRAWKEAAICAENPHTGMGLRCSTDLPGVQLYTSNVLNEPTGKEGRPLTKYRAFCLETQFFPDTPNRPQFPSCQIAANDRFETVTRYEFFKMK